MKHYCTVCNSIHEGRCKRPRLYQRIRNSTADRFRNTQAWRRTAVRIMDRDHNCCRVCLTAGIVESRNLSVHHIRSLATDYDRRLDENNLITLCRYHHEQAEIGRISVNNLSRLAMDKPVLPPYPDKKGFSGNDIGRTPS